MNYYEELGVSPGASSDEIRHAYKMLARLLHPDPIADERMKRLAELQMRRLNHILAVLTDAAARRRYNLEMEGSAPAIFRRRVPGVPAPVRRSRWRSLAIGTCAWLPPVAGVAFIVAALLYTGASPVPGSTTPAVSAAAVRAAAPELPAEPIRPRAEGFHPDRKRGVVESSTALHASISGGLPSTLERPAPTPVMAGSPAIMPQAAAFRPPIPAPQMVPALPPKKSSALPANPRPQLAGNWLYVPPRENGATTGLYPPEYIELRLTEKHGMLQGHYRARYQVTDQAISPEVEFHFEGPDSTAEFPWNGAGTATGTVKLRLLSPDQLQVNWIATQLSEELGLVSGQAELIRQQESR